MRGLRSCKRQEGNATVLALVALTLLAGLSLAQFSFTRRKLQQSNYFLSHSELRRYAESGMAIAFHHLTFDLNGGNLGTVSWDVGIDDLGEDGVGGTGDHGEGDGIPTPGEPNVVPASVGSNAVGARLIAHVSDTAFPNVKRIVATSFIPGRPGETVTLEKQVQKILVTIPRPGAVYVDPAIALNLYGNAFLIDGNDTNPDGSDGPGTDQYGLATAVGSPPGTSAANLLAQITSSEEDNITGLGTTPSIGEVAAVDFGGLVNQFAEAPNQTIPPGTYGDVTWGDWASDDMITTYVSGDLTLTGTSSGSGVLVVDGDLLVSGDFTFMGLIVVTGDVRLVGGAAGVHVWGSLMAQGGLDAVDPSVAVSGTAEMHYSSEVLDQLEQNYTQYNGYETVYYGERS